MVQGLIESIQGSAPPLSSSPTGSLSAGSWTPIISGEVNTVNAGISDALFHRIGNIVFCQIVFSFNPTVAATLTQFEFTMPVDPASTFGGGQFGTGSLRRLLSDADISEVTVIGVSGTNRMKVNAVPALGSTVYTGAAVFTYDVS